MAVGADAASGSDATGAAAGSEAGFEEGSEAGTAAAGVEAATGAPTLAFDCAPAQPNIPKPPTTMSAANAVSRIREKCLIVNSCANSFILSGLPD
ncbi:hypothetical protein Busp01_47070 [Trinickia caryophylli]|nr:hypothetical protein Busp01_47070 [Trinickia caryophylli]